MLCKTALFQVTSLKQKPSGHIICFYQRLKCAFTCLREFSYPVKVTGTSTAGTNKIDMDTLSKHAQEALQAAPALNGHFRTVRVNRYHPTSNPQGIVDFGLAENKVCADLLAEKMKNVAQSPEDESLLFYEKSTGNSEFKTSMKRFLERKFHAREELNVDTLFITNGVTVLLESLSFALAEPGEYIMVPAPYYYRIRNDLFERPGVNVLDFPLVQTKQKGKTRLQLDTAVMEDVYQSALNQGKRVRAVMIVNPVNPTGDVIDAAQLTELLDFADRHKLHVISNEIYGLSIFDPEVTFTSILALPHPDPERVHFTWGVSKDFGLSGYRCAAIYTRNPGLAQYITLTAIYYRATGLIQRRLQFMLDDDEWVDKVFLPTLKQRMNTRFREIRSAMEELDVEVYPSPATIFLWINLSKYMPAPTFQGEEDLFHQLLKAGVFLVPGRDFYHTEPGWFRVVCSVEEPVYQEGLRRFVTVLRSIKQQK